MAPFAKGHKVALIAGRDKGRVGRITKASDLFTSRYEVEVAGRARKARPTKRQMVRVNEGKPGLLDRLWSTLWS